MKITGPLSTPDLQEIVAKLKLRTQKTIRSLNSDKATLHFRLDALNLRLPDDMAVVQAMTGEDDESTGSGEWFVFTKSAGGWKIISEGEWVS